MNNIIKGLRYWVQLPETYSAETLKGWAERSLEEHKQLLADYEQTSEKHADFSRSLIVYLAAMEACAGNAPDVVAFLNLLKPAAENAYLECIRQWLIDHDSISIEDLKANEGEARAVCARAEARGNAEKERLVKLACQYVYHAALFKDRSENLIRALEEAQPHSSETKLIHSMFEESSPSLGFREHMVQWMDQLDA